MYERDGEKYVGPAVEISVLLQHGTVAGDVTHSDKLLNERTSDDCPNPTLAKPITSLASS